MHYLHKLFNSSGLCKIYVALIFAFCTCPTVSHAALRPSKLAEHHQYLTKTHSYYDSLQVWGRIIELLESEHHYIYSIVHRPVDQPDLLALLRTRRSFAGASQRRNFTNDHRRRRTLPRRRSFRSSRSSRSGGAGSSRKIVLTPRKNFSTVPNRIDPELSRRKTFIKTGIRGKRREFIKN